MGATQNAQEEDPVIEISSDDDYDDDDDSDLKDTPKGLIMIDGVKRTPRPHKPTHRFTFPEFD